MYFIIVLLCVIVMAQFSSLQRFADESKAVPNYTGCSKREDTICKKRTASDCWSRNVKIQCPRLCGDCAPFNPKCPAEFPFGCCWNGERALDMKKSNCKKCQDRNPKYCQLEAILADCDMTENTAETREICPESCKACHDYGFVPCEDSDPRCAKMEDTACCESSEILQDLCKKTCGICL